MPATVMVVESAEHLARDHSRCFTIPVSSIEFAQRTDVTFCHFEHNGILAGISILKPSNESRQQSLDSLNDLIDHVFQTFCRKNCIVTKGFLGDSSQFDAE